MSVLSNSQNLTINGSTFNVVSGNQTNINANVLNIVGTSDSANHLAAMTTMPSSYIRSAPMISGKRALPRLSTMFTGRQDILQQLAQYLDPTVTSVVLKKQRIFVLHGLGGAGKTQIMAKFVDEFGDKFFGIYYVDASTLETIQASFEDIAQNTAAGNTVDDALHWFAQERKDWLLIVDNADDPKINLRPFFPRCRHGNVIITTRNPDCRLYAPESNCNVSGMKSDDAIELLLKCAMVEHSERNRNLCGSICKELGYLALAVTQAGAYIAQCCPLGDFLQIYHEDRSKLLQEHSLQTADDYQRTVYTTWEMSLKKLSSNASGILRLCAFMHHGGISKAIFQNAATAGDLRDAFRDGNHFLNNFKSPSGEWSNIKFLECIKELVSYSLISINTENHLYSIHPLVHTWSRCRTSLLEQSETQNCVLQILALAVNDDYSAEAFAFRRSLLPHIDESRTEVLEPDIGDKLQQVYSEGLRFRAAEEMQKPIMEARRRVLGENHLETLSSMSNLACTYRRQGRWKEAEELDLQVMCAAKMHLGFDHQDTLTSMANLASTYWNQGRWEEAEKLELQVMDATRKLLGVDHPDTLTSMANLASTYKTQGRWKEAEELFLQVINVTRVLLGVDHPDTLTSMANLASTYWKQGRWEAAEELDLQVIDARRRLLSVDHPDTLQSMANLACTYWNQGRWKEAEEHFLQVVDAARRLLGIDHPDTLSSMANLACTYWKQGRWKEAEELELRVMDTTRRRLGIDHPDTLYIMSNLACTYRSQGRLKDAEDLDSQVIQLKGRLLVDDC